MEHAEKVKELSGYHAAAARIDEKLDQWKTGEKRDYFLEEILKLPYLKGMK